MIINISHITNLKRASKQVVFFTYLICFFLCIQMCEYLFIYLFSRSRLKIMGEDSLCLHLRWKLSHIYSIMYWNIFFFHLDMQTNILSMHHSREFLYFQNISITHKNDNREKSHKFMSGFQLFPDSFVGRTRNLRLTPLHRPTISAMSRLWSPGHISAFIILTGAVHIFSDLLVVSCIVTAFHQTKWFNAHTISVCSYPG